MAIDVAADSLIRHWRAPAPSGVGTHIEGFLRALGGPCCIELPGRDRSRCRVLVTLLHGNETSGIRALQQLIRESFEPAVTLHCYVIAVRAALLDPLFTHRQLPGGADYNRCFRAPSSRGLVETVEFQVAQQLLREVRALRPEAVVDMHNTSGEGPSFAVTTALADRHEPIISLFTERLVVSDLRLGALMESDSEALPIVTIECGGAFEESADRVALEGLRRYFGRTDITKGPDADWPLDTYLHPMRVEIASGTRLAYAEQAEPSADLTLHTNIEHHNFTTVTPDTRLGWMRSDVRGGVSVRDAQGHDRFATLYRVIDGALYPRQRQKLFMITSDPAIAVSDCLWYTVIE